MHPPIISILPYFVLVTMALAAACPVPHSTNPSINKRARCTFPEYEEIMALEAYCRVNDPDLKSPHCRALFGLRKDLLDQLNTWFAPYFVSSDSEDVGQLFPTQTFKANHQPFVKFFFETGDSLKPKQKKEVFDRWGRVFEPFYEHEDLIITETTLAHSALAFASRFLVPDKDLGAFALKVLGDLSVWNDLVSQNELRPTAKSMEEHLSLGKEAMRSANEEVVKLQEACADGLAACPALEANSRIIEYYLDSWFGLQIKGFIIPGIEEDSQLNQDLWVANHHRYLVAFRGNFYFPFVQTTDYEKCLRNWPLSVAPSGYENTDEDQFEAQIARLVMSLCGIPIMHGDSPEEKKEGTRAVVDKLVVALDGWKYLTTETTFWPATLRAAEYGRLVREMRSLALKEL